MDKGEQLRQMGLKVIELSRVRYGPEYLAEEKTDEIAAAIGAPPELVLSAVLAARRKGGTRACS